MTGEFVDLHCHYLPNVDDGVRSLEDGMSLCQGLRALGYQTVVATPHIRTGMFDNDAQQLRASFRAFQEAAVGDDRMPELGMGAEHHFDDRVWQRILDGEGVCYPGGTALLIELPEERLPLGLEARMFDLRRRGLHPVLAHPERYAFLGRRSEALFPLLQIGTLPLLDLMSLTGKYGRSPQRSAERMLREGLYYAACSDAHRFSDVETVEDAIERLVHLVGPEQAQQLLGDRPRRVLRGALA